MSPRAYVAGKSDARYAVFSVSPAMTPGDATLPGALANYLFDRSPVLPSQLIDAVATAGRRAAASQKRRAVVLVVTDCGDVSGQWSLQGVRRYLAQLRVPFRVWVVGPPTGLASAPAAGDFCDGAQEIRDVRLYQSAIKQLKDDLQAQQIVWVEGSHLLRKITLTGDSPGLRLAE